MIMRQISHSLKGHKNTLIKILKFMNFESLKIIKLKVFTEYLEAFLRLLDLRSVSCIKPNIEHFHFSYG